MARYAYERLSAQDTSFLFFESSTVYMHVASAQIYRAGPFLRPDGGIDVERFRRGIQSVLHLIPRYRQKLQFVPMLGTPVWVDDRSFNLDYHVRHTSLPRPGTEEQLRRLAARVLAQRLDRNKPLWEIWVVEGLEGDRFATLNKIHHCMIDGAAGVDLSYILMSDQPDRELPEPAPYIPRPAPTGAELLRGELLRRAAMPLRMVRGLRAFHAEAEDAKAELALRARALGELLGWALRRASDTPLNGELGPHRRVDWLSMPLDPVKEVRRAFGCTLNDVVLAVVAGAIRSFLQGRHVDPAALDFRVSAPVSVRRDEDRGKLGNRVSSWIVPLPLGEPNPRRRLEAIHERTRELKATRQAMGVDMLMSVAEWSPSILLSLGARAVSGPINLIVTNVPGPQVPLYLLGAEMLECYPQVPLLPNTGLGIALMSYRGGLFWGFSADYDLLPDLEDLVRAVRTSFAELAAAAPRARRERDRQRPAPRGNGADART